MRAAKIRKAVPHFRLTRKMLTAVSKAARVWPDGKEITAEGTCEGIIRDFYKGNGGFGYDPLFYLPQYGKTMAEISMEEKNKISHRGKAIQALLNELKKL